VLGEYISIDYLPLIGIGLPLVVMVIGFACGRQLALASNLSFVYASFVAYAWWQVPRGSQAASLGVLSIPSGPDLYRLVVLLGASLVSFVISHVLYVRAVGARAVRARAPCPRS